MAAAECGWVAPNGASCQACVVVHEQRASRGSLRNRRQLSQYPLFEYEFALLANLLPETVEEAVTLIPSLQVRGSCTARGRGSVADAVAIARRLRC